jgi:hypothetical protein
VVDPFLMVTTFAVVGLGFSLSFMLGLCVAG